MVLLSHLLFNGPAAHANTFTFNCTGGTYTVNSGVLQGNSTCTGAVVLDSSVTRIEYATFFEGGDGQSITSISIPASVTYISSDFPLGFRNSDLTQYIVDPNNPNYSSVDGVLYSKDQTHLIAYPRGKAGSTFSTPNSVTTVSNYAFQCSRYLETISIGANVTTLNDAFFNYGGACWSGSLVREITVSASNSNYSSVDGVLFNKNVTRLIKYPYAKPGTSYTVPSTVTQIGGFGNNTTLTSITLPEGLRTIDTYAFTESIITSISIPDSVVSYGSYPFYLNRALESFTVGAANSILKSVDGVLYSKDGTTLLEYPGGRRNESFSIPSGVTTLASQWTYAQYLKSMTVPSTVTAIGSGGFSNWYQDSYLVFQGNSSLSSISGNYATNIIYCGAANSEITAHAASVSGTVSCQSQSPVPEPTPQPVEPPTDTAPINPIPEPLPPIDPEPIELPAPEPIPVERPQENPSIEPLAASEVIDAVFADGKITPADAEAVVDSLMEDGKVTEAEATALIETLTDGGALSKAEEDLIVDALSADGEITQGEVNNLSEILSADGKFTEAEKELVAEALIESADGKAVTVESIAEAGITLEDLPAEQPVEVRQDENGNEVVITAEVAVALELLTSAGDIVSAIFENPSQLLFAIGNLGADMSDEERKEAGETIIAATIVGNIATTTMTTTIGGIGYRRLN
jgi:polyhydroxyalkanoate synthesis regulator phasin